MSRIRSEVSILREVVRRYGDRFRMATAPEHLQQAIDAAMAENNTELAHYRSLPAPVPDTERPQAEREVIERVETFANNLIINHAFVGSLMKSHGGWKDDVDFERACNDLAADLLTIAQSRAGEVRGRGWPDEAAVERIARGLRSLGESAHLASDGSPSPTAMTCAEGADLIEIFARLSATSAPVLAAAARVRLADADNLQACADADQWLSECAHQMPRAVALSAIPEPAADEGVGG